MEDTQVVNWDVEEEEEVEERPSESLGCSLEPLGQLHIFSSSYGPEKDFPLYLGKNVVGRMPECSVSLPFSSISKQHAVIEILAWDKAPVLRDCGSLNGTQILRPPKVLGPGVSHRLRDREIILFADLACQYHRLDVLPPYVSRGPLIVEETPRVQRGTQPHRLLLAEDSEEDVDSPERRVVKEPRTFSLATVVPESDEEGPSPAPDGPGPPFAFHLNSDTDDKESQQPGSGEASCAAGRGPAAETEPLKPVTTEIQLEKDQCSPRERNQDTEVKPGARNGVVPVGVIVEMSQPAEEDSDTDVGNESWPPGQPAVVHSERAQPSGFIDSDTDEEEEGIPATPAVVPVKKRQIFHEVGTEHPRAPDEARLQDSPAGSDTDIEEREARLTGPLERSQGSMMIDSDTDDEEEVSAALTLARLRESQAVMWNRGSGTEADRAQPVVLLKPIQASAGRDSDTDVEEEGLPLEKIGTVPKGHTDKTHSEKSQPSLRGSDIEAEEDKSSPGVHLERSQASASVGVNPQVEEEVPPGSAVILLDKHQVPVAWTRQTDVEAEGGPAKLPVVHLEEAQPLPAGGCEPDVEEDTSLAASVVADVSKSQLPAERDAGTEWAAAVLEQDRALTAGAQDGSQVEPGLHSVSRENLADLVVDTGTPGELTQSQREGAQPPSEREREPHVDGTMNSGDNHDDSEDLDLQATQCFVERENPSLKAVPSMEDEPTQAFLFTLPQEPGPSRCSFQAAGALDEPWEVLATQPFCPRESEASVTQPIATHLEAHRSCPSPPGAALPEQHPESPLGMQGRGMQTVEKDMGTPRETAERVTPETGPLERETKELPSEGEREDAVGEEELTRGIQDREQKQVLSRDAQRQESDNKVKSASTERDRKSLKVEIETHKEIQEKEAEQQTLAREINEREAEKEGSEREHEAGGLEVKVLKVILERNPQRWEAEKGGQDQKGQASSLTPEPGVGLGDLQGLASAPVASGSQSGGGRGAPVSPRRQQRGQLNCKMPPAEKASRGDQESPEACLPPEVHEASAFLHSPLISQSQKPPAPQSLPSPSPPPLELPIPRTRQNEGQEALETPLSSELDPPYPNPKIRPQGSSPVSSLPCEPHSTTPTDQPVRAEPTSRVTRSRTQRSLEMTPVSVVPTAPELQPSTSTDQSVTLKPTLRATRGRTHRSSVKTSEPVVPITPELQASTPADQPVAPELTSAATRGRAHRTSVKTSDPVVPTAAEPQPSTSAEQLVTPKSTSRAGRGRTRCSSVKTSESVVPTTPEPQPSTPTDQPVIPELISRATRGRTHRFSVKTPEPVVPIALEPQPSAPTDQPVTPELTSRATRGRIHRSSVKTPEPVVPTASEPQPSTSTDQPVTPKPTSRASRGRTHRSSAKTPEPLVPTVPELQHSVPTDQPVAPEPTSGATQSRTCRSSVKTSEPVVPTTSEPQPSTSKDQCLTPEPPSQATRGRIHRSSVKTSQPVEPTAHDLEPPSLIDQPVTPKVIAQSGQSRTLRSSTVSAVPVSTTPEFQSPEPTEQPVPPKPIPQANCSRRPRATRKHGSLPAPTVHEPCTTPPEPNSRSSRNQRRGAGRAAESVSTIPEPTFAQLPEVPPHAPQIQKGEAAGRSGFTPEPQPKASQNRKRPLATSDSPPLQKRLQRGEVPQKTAFFTEEENTATRPGKEEDVVMPGAVKRKRGQAEEEPPGTQSRSLRQTKSNQEPTAPKVLFTGVVDARGQRAVLALGGSLASSVAEASHLVTDRIRRTVKFLCALGRGIPILSLDWLHQSRKAGCFLPPDEYVVTDPEQEKNFGFSLREALSRARERRLLEGYEIHVTPGVQPPPLQMGEIISCCGGTFLPSMPRSYKPQRVVITCSKDFPRCSIPFRVGLPILSPEFLLTGVLKQEAKPEAFVLSTLKMSSI
ncbi:mediator of DNA damage checkpoint protein 1 isoform X1 [Camelus bactrianus]|uniref:Mediator of DNA damage checkpoint protein 1 isoform X1 n=1 Tax=Camelus bactrianus TaxID=9837 RepID=A0AC58P312_CAMBA